jgi:adenosylcobinamide hydrolase
VRHDPEVRRVGDSNLPVLCWELAAPMRAIASAPRGGGLGARRWVINAQVPSDYSRTDIDQHLDDLARDLGLVGDGVGFLTAAPVDAFTTAVEGGVQVFATVGLEHPTWAADDDDVPSGTSAGTINVIAFVPARLDDAAFVNAVATVTEAKAQALFHRDVPGTGTASDAVCVLSPTRGPVERFAGPRSPIGSQLARATLKAVSEGADRK